MPFAADPVWRAFTQAGPASLRTSLSPRAKSPGQGQLAAFRFSTSTDEFEAGKGAMPRALGRPAEILCARGRMIAFELFLTIRGASRISGVPAGGLACGSIDLRNFRFAPVPFSADVLEETDRAET